MDVKIDLRACVKGILQGTPPPRPLFLPIVFSHAARTENLPLRAFLANPTKITQALRQLRAHLRSDGVTCYCDPFLEAEALGATLEWSASAQPSIRWPRNPLNGDLHDVNALPTRGRIPIAVEVIRRMKSLLREEALLIATLSGPLALAAQIGLPAAEGASGSHIPEPAVELASAAITPITTAFLEAGANVIFIREDLPAATKDFSAWASHLATTTNVIRFYGALPVLVLNAGSENLEGILQQPSECILSPVLTDSILPVLEKIEKPSPANFGIALPVGKTSSGTTGAPISNEILRRFVSEFQPALITTSGDVPDDVDLKDLNKLRETLIA